MVELTHFPPLFHPPTQNKTYQIYTRNISNKSAWLLDLMRLPPCESNGYKLNSCRVVHAFGVRSRNTTWQHLASLSLREFCRPYLLRPFLLTPLPKSTNNGTTFDQKRDQSGLRGGQLVREHQPHFLFSCSKSQRKKQNKKNNYCLKCVEMFQKMEGSTAVRLLSYYEICK